MSSILSRECIPFRFLISTALISLHFFASVSDLGLNAFKRYPEPFRIWTMTHSEFVLKGLFTYIMSMQYIYKNVMLYKYSMSVFL